MAVFLSISIQSQLHIGFHHVISCLNLCSGIAQTRPVSHNNAITPPLISQDGSKEFTILLCEGAIHPIV